MADALRDSLRDLGLRVRVYAPIGELLPGIAYLVRRLLENSANTGFLRLSGHEKRPLAELLAPPAGGQEAGQRARNREDWQAWPGPRRQGGGFRNCAHADFTDPRGAAAVHPVPGRPARVAAGGGPGLRHRRRADQRQAAGALLPRRQGAGGQRGHVRRGGGRAGRRRFGAGGVARLARHGRGSPGPAPGETGRHAGAGEVRSCGAAVPRGREASPRGGRRCRRGHRHVPLLRADGAC